MTNGRWEKTGEGDPLWVPNGASVCPCCGGCGACFGFEMGGLVETGEVCSQCSGAGYTMPAPKKVVRIRRRPSTATENIEVALGASMILARGGVGRFPKAVNEGGGR